MQRYKVEVTNRFGAITKTGSKIHLMKKQTLIPDDVLAETICGTQVQRSQCFFIEDMTLAVDDGSMPVCKICDRRLLKMTNEKARELARKPVRKITDLDLRSMNLIPAEQSLDDHCRIDPEFYVPESEGEAANLPEEGDGND